MPNDLSFPAPPNLPTETSDETAGRKTLEAHYYTHMSETEAKARRDVAKNTYAIPARQETYRYVATIVLVGFLIYELLPVFISKNPSATTIALVIAAGLAIVGAKPAIDSIVKYFQGS